MQAITTAIAERRLMPGTKLAEQPLADIFQVSRTVVRQALNQLSRHRLVTLTPSRGASVAEPSAEEARQVFEVRQMLETAMVRSLAGGLSRAQLAQLQSHLQQEAAAVARTDVPGRTRLLADFHPLLARMLGNEVLANVLHDLLLRSSLIALVVQSAHSAEASHREHAAIVDALAQGDGRAAARLMKSHLGQVAANLQHPAGLPDLAEALAPLPAPTSPPARRGRA